MTISSRAPEGVPHRCPVCGKTAPVEPSYPAGDSCCPSCGALLSWLRYQVGEPITLSSRFDEGWMDSLDVVDLVMDLEERVGVDIPAEVAERVQAVEDLLRYVAERRGET